MNPNDDNLSAAGEPLRQALEEIGRSGRNLPGSWLVGGSTGLLLQGVPLAAPPRDLDLYTDRETAAELHGALLAWSVDKQEESATEIYRSILSHYVISGVNVELVGAFEVRTPESAYRVEAEYLRREHALTLRVGEGTEAGLMPLAHELLFNLLRRRPDRYEAIAAVMVRRRDGRELAALRELLSRNRFGGEALKYARSVVASMSPDGGKEP
ncbi:hypothetical protein J2T17_001366 [Paenibacillus mucilaginosus]|uniref:hypothetical protein n=1 Tax=Paenibacillus mucilaginosus TaxID=61624 RepID=UPI003D24848B